MTTAQPGQEQRMEPYCQQCCGPCLRKPSHLEPQQLSTRPTADLGEDGELIAALWSYAHDLKLAVPLRQAMEDARDRLILYREALVAVEHAESVEIARDIARALLSKSEKETT